MIQDIYGSDVMIDPHKESKRDDDFETRPYSRTPLPNTYDEGTLYFP